ncbi:unnamed protein product [Rotaria sp. Silwood1]|nr:unnamed protein product [Rotaria sp. Silwood1]CAF3589933.1 unnamed protein product [Rotaria sp. Silwood1]CAF3617266.1 unnamed protein product [Rotaria sp. Silwood1]CAF4670264.1 unnamed protein product [Rotaria sp. Silwood1]CAF4776922.1 unnamed protein product [Rotaria sp. Silwood1]
MVYSILATAFSIYVSLGHGRAAVGVLIGIYFFESIMFPTIFVLGTENLGRHIRRGAGILIMGVSGGAVFPPIQGVIADVYSTRISFLVPMVGFVVVFAYATFHWLKTGFQMRHKRYDVNVTVSSIAEHNNTLTVVSSQQSFDSDDSLKEMSLIDPSYSPSDFTVLAAQVLEDTNQNKIHTTKF